MVSNRKQLVPRGLPVFFIATGLACTPLEPEAPTTTTSGSTGDATTGGPQGPSTTDGAPTTGSEPAATTGFAATTTTTSGPDETSTATSTGEDTGARTSCGDGVAAAGELCFVKVERDENPTQWLEVGDLDNDGHLDLVGFDQMFCPIQRPAGQMLTSGPTPLGPREGSLITSVRPALGDGKGGFVEVDVVMPAVVETAGFVLAEVTGDETLDLLMIDAQTRVVILAGDGAGSFTAFAEHDLPIAAVDLAAGDLDADGAVDVVAIGAAGMSVLVGDGLGGFTADAFATVGPFQKVVLSDVDGDDDLDVVYAGAAAEKGEIDVWRGEGDASFTHTHSATFAGTFTDLAVLGAAQDGMPTALIQVLVGDQRLLRHYPILQGPTFGEPGEVPADTHELLAPGRFDGGDGVDVARIGVEHIDVILDGLPWPSAPLAIAGDLELFILAFDGPRVGDVNEDGVDDIILSTRDLLLSNP